ncbi:hypothetical protein [Vulgatibacter incomptus]|uniref:Cytochrome b561 domain-containing protein n=1 Tax=Vulgatibacter incomptus TaxID=1391653 RepID=A0A0K1PCA9_9BACT|nr:hypothetical protein [Vulgatibacter incomptus]AKU91051.1 hypothetical protein AKJ08_1438 [Vulgatibacter incomptus]
MGKVVRLPDSDRDGRRSMGVGLSLLISAGMFAGLLVLQGILRSGSSGWPVSTVPRLPKLLPFLASGAIATISITMFAAVRALLSAHLERMRRLLGVAELLSVGLAAVGTALFVAVSLAGGGRSTTVVGVLGLLLALFGAHVLAGIGMLAWLRRGARRERYHARDSIHVRLVARFWHFLAGCWLAIHLACFVL